MFRSFRRIDKLAGRQDGEPADCGPGEVTLVAGHEFATQRTRAFRKRGVIGIRKAVDKMPRGYFGIPGHGLNAEQDDVDFVRRKSKLGTRQHLFILSGNPVVQTRPHRTTAQPFDDSTGGARCSSEASPRQTPDAPAPTEVVSVH